MNAIMSARQKISVLGGTVFSQNANMLGISYIRGIDMRIINAEENLLSLPANESISCRSPCPSAFIICGFMALRMEVDTNLMAPFTCDAMPNDAFMIVPNTLLRIMAVP